VVIALNCYDMISDPLCLLNRLASEQNRSIHQAAAASAHNSSTYNYSRIWSVYRLPNEGALDVSSDNHPAHERDDAEARVSQSIGTGVSTSIQTRARDRLSVADTGRFPSPDYQRSTTPTGVCLLA
jgi:hypothetical protein